MRPQVSGAERIAEATEVAGRGAGRTGQGFLFGLIFAVCLYTVIFGKVWRFWSPNLATGKGGEWVTRMGLTVDVWPPSGPGTFVIIVIITTIILAILSGISGRFTCLVVGLSGGSLFGAIAGWAVAAWLCNMLLGQIVYFILLIIIALPIWIHLLVKNNLEWW